MTHWLEALVARMVLESLLLSGSKGRDVSCMSEAICKLVLFSSAPAFLAC